MKNKPKYRKQIKRLRNALTESQKREIKEAFKWGLMEPGHNCPYSVLFGTLYSFGAIKLRVDSKQKNIAGGEYMTKLEHLWIENLSQFNKDMKYLFADLPKRHFSEVFDYTPEQTKEVIDDETHPLHNEYMDFIREIRDISEAFGVSTKTIQEKFQDLCNIPEEEKAKARYIYRNFIFESGDWVKHVPTGKVGLVTRLGEDNRLAARFSDEKNDWTHGDSDEFEIIQKNNRPKE